jgi:hypothetical protein
MHPAALAVGVAALDVVVAGQAYIALHLGDPDDNRAKTKDS